MKGAALFLVFAIAGPAHAASLVVSPPSVDFGVVLVQSYASDTLSLTNAGTQPIVLGEYSTDHDAFDAGSRDGEPRPGTVIAPNASIPLLVSFRPPAEGPVSGSLQIASSDPAAPEITIPLSGTGAYPAITVLPTSFTLTLPAGDTASRTLWIANPGDVDLDWSIAFAPVEEGARPGAIDAAAALAHSAPVPSGGDLAGIAILWDRGHGQQASSFWSTVIGDVTQRGATVTESSATITAELLEGKRILWSQDAGQAWSADEIQALDDWVTGGGGLLLEGDNPGSIPVFNAITNALGAQVQYATHTGGQGLTTTIFPHPTTEDVIRIDVALHQAKLASIGGGTVELIRDPIDAPVAAATRVGAGRVVALADELLQNTVTGTGRDNRLFANQVIEWLAGASWITANPAAGRIAPDSSRFVALAIDTEELPAGVHQLDATIASNDPDRPEVIVEVTLTVLGRPDVDVSRTEIGFGSVPVGSTETDSVVVRNAGEEPLHVTSMNVAGATFTSDGAPATIAPGDSVVVHVTFAPVMVGPASGTLTIASDDPDEASVVIALSGSGQTDCTAGCAVPSVDVPDLPASNGVRFALPVTIAGNPSPIDAFGFDLEFDPDMLAFGDSAAAASLTGDFILVSAEEIAPGRVRCAGFGSAAIPPGSTGEIIRVFFDVDCASCIPGDASSLVVSGVTDDLVGMNACCGTFTFSTCSPNGDVNHDGQLSPGDALCAIQIFLSGQIVPTECDVTGNCEVTAADANCDSTVTAGDALAIYDAYLAGEAPYPCFAAGGHPASEAARAWLEAQIRSAAATGDAAAAVELTAGPTPSRGPIEIACRTAVGAPLRLRIVDVAGRLVRTLHDGDAPGALRLAWDRRDDHGAAAAPGVYFVRLETGPEARTRRIVLLR